MRRHTTPRAGFSMIEMLIVLAVMGILVTMGITFTLSARPRAQRERGEVMLSARLNEARNLAITEEVMTRVVLDSANGTLQVQRQDPGGTTWTDVSVARELPEGVSFGTITFASNTVSFNTRGSLVSSGAITITAGAGQSTTLTGNLATGRFMLGGGNLR
jgi:prepilin-type N-terminal cleavage/methylation domain-containing protein